MKNKIFKLSNCFILCLIVSLLTISCKKDTDSPLKKSNCPFVQNDEDMEGLIDDEERALLNQCKENKLTSKSDIETHLIGEWELIGYGAGSFSSVSQPCSYITITENELVFEFKNEYMDTLTTHTWEVTENGSGHFSLEFVPNNKVRVFINIFCSEYMYGNGTPIDSNMHLYQKVN